MIYHVVTCISVTSTSAIYQHMSLDISRDLEHLVRGLRGQPSSSAKDLVGRAVYYLPSIKNENNVGLLAFELISSPIVLPVGDSTLSDGLYLVDAFSSAAQRKAQVSNATVPPVEWNYRLLTLASNMPLVESWRTVPMLVALIQSQTLSPDHSKIAEQLLANTVAAHMVTANHISKMICISVSRIVLLVSQPQILLSEVLFDIATSLLYLGPLESPEKDIIYQNLSGLSHVIKLCIETSITSYHIDEFLNHMDSYGEKLNQWCLNLPPSRELPWTKLKTSLFGICLQLEGLAMLMLHRPTFNQSKSYFASKILRILSSFYFIITALGQGDFDSYQFVYNVAIDCLDDPTDCIIALCGKCNLGAVNPIEISRITYLLDFFEAALTKSSDSVVEDTVVPITRRFLVPKRHVRTDFPIPEVGVLESAHSVMLAYLSSKTRPPHIIRNYLEIVLSLFPGLLVSTQFTLAIATIVRAVSQDPALLNEFLGMLFLKSKAALPGIPLKAQKNDNSDENNRPPTVRAVFINCLIHALPFLEISDFERWLNTTAGLFRGGPAYSNLVVAEQQFLECQLWNMLSGELGQTLADVGIRWWYNPRI